MESNLKVGGWGIMSAATVVKVSAQQRRELDRIVSRPSEGAGLVRRAQVILLSAAGESGSEIGLRLDLSSEAVSRIRRRFREGGVEGLYERPKAGRKDHAVPTETVERVVELAMSHRRPGEADGRLGCWPRRSASRAD